MGSPWLGMEINKALFCPEATIIQNGRETSKWSSYRVAQYHSGSLKMREGPVWDGEQSTGKDSENRGYWSPKGKPIVVSQLRRVSGREEKMLEDMESMVHSANGKGGECGKL